ncbi:MAG: carboxymuconolactone decarboxylase family protein [Chitinophagaceae bacterium]|nr:carboxymuconolactone decarboxylase family protein [Chitinophagaceae bacterium]
MKKIKPAGLMVLILCISLFANRIHAQDMATDSASLSEKEKSIIIISSFAAKGGLIQLKSALNEGLDAGLTINEIKEMLVQLYAYTGFPRSLNALGNLMAVLEERKKRGINDSAGREPFPYPPGKNMLQAGTENQTKLTGRTFEGGIFEFAPAIDQFLKEHLFGAIFSRDNLDWKTREIVTIAALAAMEGVESQLRSHYAVGIYNGLTSSQLSELVTIVETNVNTQRGIIAREVLQSLLDDKPYNSIMLPDNLIFPRGEKITNNNFIGNAYLYQMIMPDSLNPTMVGCVTFEPGARSNWHRHPGGQILVIVDGTGYYQEQGSPKRIIKKGESIKCPPNIPHWHGASKKEQLIQIAITNNQNGPTVWLQPVTEEEYRSPGQK